LSGIEINLSDKDQKPTHLDWAIKILCMH
jgi:hypothetical protein